MADWAGEERSGCLLLRELPPRPTQRTCKVSTELEPKTTALDLASFPGDHSEQQLQLGAFKEAWDSINSTIKELREQHLAPVLQHLQQWAAASAPALQQHHSGVNTASTTSSAAAALACSSQAVAAVAGVDGATAADLRQLPTAVLSVASSSNTADTYAHLIAALKKQGHPVAVVSAREAAAGLSAVINSAMRRFLNSPTAADDMPALLAWWQDEWQCAYGAAAGINGAVAAAAGQQTPKTGSKARSRAAADDARAMDLDGDVAHPAAAAVAAATPPRTASKAAAAAATPATAGRELRVRPGPKTPGRPGGGSAAAAGQGVGCSSLGVPVLVLQEADVGYFEALEELVMALSEARTAGLPIVLVLGVSSSPACLLQLLPNALLRRVCLLSLALPPARQQLVQVYRQLLLCEPALLLGPQLSSWLLQHFRDADCSASMAERVMQLACVEHFRSQPLSCLAAAATSGSRAALAKAVAALPHQQLTRCCQALLAHPSSALTGDGSSSSSSSSSSSKRSPAGKAQPSTAAAAAAVEKLQAFLHPAGGKQRSDDKAAAAAAAAGLEEAVWGAMQAFGRWRLGVLLLHLLAEFTGLASRDASLQLPSLFSAASQQHFMHSSKRGSLSPCGHLLLKLLGNSSSSGSSSSSRSGVLAVRDLADADCLQLLEKLLHVVTAGGQEQQQADAGKQGKQQQRRASGGRLDAGIVISDSEDSSSDEQSGSGSDSDSDSDDDERPDTAKDGVLGSCLEVQQLQQALAALQAAASGAAAAPNMLAAAAATAVADDAAILTSPQKKQKRHHKQQDQQQQQSDVLAAFTESFAALLAPLPELLEPKTAAASRNGMLTSSAAAAAGTPGSVSTPIGKGAAGRGSDSLPTPGGLTSALRRHVRFAPDTPNHAASKAGAAGSNMSTPDDAVAVAGYIKTPSKKVSKPAQPRKSLFGAPAAGPAAAGAAAAAADGAKMRKKRGEKQKDEEGDIAGTSAAALAAAVAAASGSAAGAASAAAKATNKRSQRLMQLLAASGPSGCSGGSSSPGSGVGGGSGSSTPVSGSKRCSSSSRGLLSTPQPADATTAAAAVGSPDTSLSPRGRASSRQRGSVAAAAAAAGDGGAAGMLTSPRGGARGTSRLSRQSQPHHMAAAAAADETDDDDEMGVDEQEEQQLQQQQHKKGKAAAAAVQVEAAAPSAAASCSAALASLLSAVIPKLLSPWCSPSSSSSSRPSTVNNSSSSSASSPLAAAGAAAFVYDDLAHVSTLLCAAPRCAVHAALTDPAQRMPGHPQHLGPGWEDTCLAYMLLQQQREDGLAVADWFGLFCQAQGIQGFSSAADAAAAEAEAEGAAAPGTGRAARARARQGRKARGYAEARDSAAAAAAPSNSKKKAGSSSSRDQATPKSAAKERGAAAAADDADTAGDQQVDAEELMAAAARFCQSAAELQLLGVWKASKKRRLAAVTRMFAPEGPGMVLRGAAGGSAAAAGALESLPDHDYDD